MALEYIVLSAPLCWVEFFSRRDQSPHVARGFAPPFCGFLRDAVPSFFSLGNAKRQVDWLERATKQSTICGCPLSVSAKAARRYPLCSFRILSIPRGSASEFRTRGGACRHAGQVRLLLQ